MLTLTVILAAQPVEEFRRRQNIDVSSGRPHKVSFIVRKDCRSALDRKIQDHLVILVVVLAIDLTEDAERQKASD